MKKLVIPIILCLLIIPSVLSTMLVAEFGSDTVSLYNGETFKIKVPRGPNKIALTPNGEKAVVTSSLSDSVSIIDVNNKKVLKSLKIKNGEPFGVTISNNGKFAIVTNIDAGTISVINLESLEITKTIIVEDSPTSVVIGKDNRFAYVTNLGTSSISIVDLQLGKSIKKIVNPNLIKSPSLISLNNDGKKAYLFNTRENLLKSIDITNQKLTSLTLQALNTNINNDLRIITNFGIVSGSFEDNGAVQIIDLVDNKILKTIPIDAKVYGLDYDKGKVYVTTSKNELLIIDIKTDEIKKLRTGEKPRGVVVIKEYQPLVVATGGATAGTEEKKSFLIPILIIIAVVFIIPWIFRPKVFEEEPKKAQVSKKIPIVEEKKAETKKIQPKKVEFKEKKVETKEPESKPVVEKTVEEIIKKPVKKIAKKKTEKKPTKKEEIKKESSDDDDWIDMEEISDDEWDKMLKE